MKKWMILVAIAQVGVLLAISFQREWIYRTGNIVYLRTAPVDPRDIFRGDYVQLDYDLAIPEASSISKKNHTNLRKGNKYYQPVFVHIHKRKNGVADITDISINPPENGLYVKASIGRNIWQNYHYRGRIKYGIEKYFVEQNSGKQLERKRGKRNEWQASMEMEVAVSHSGTMVVKGHRWSDLAVQVEVLEQQNTINNTDDTDEASISDVRRNPKVAMRIRNDSNQPITLVGTPNFCYVTVLLDPPMGENVVKTIREIPFEHDNCGNDEHTNIVLGMGDMYTITIDFDDSRWQFTEKGKRLFLSQLPHARNGFRLQYRSPDIKSESGDAVWQGYLRSARFFTSGQVD